ncbi:MAG: hypothetical protein ACI4IX_07060, partial [Acutalibacteraceae bacterium]
MSLIKRTLSVALCAAMLMSFAACGEKENGTEGTETTQAVAGETTSANQEVSESLEKSPEYITDKDIYMANTVDYLLSMFNSIRITCEYAESSVVKYIFLKNGKPAYIED